MAQNERFWQLLDRINHTMLEQENIAKQLYWRNHWWRLYYFAKMAAPF